MLTKKEYSPKNNDLDKLNPHSNENNVRFSNSYIPTDRELLWIIVEKLEQLREELKNK